MPESNGIFCSTVSILMLDQFSRRRKMRIEWANLIQSPSDSDFSLEIAVVQSMTNLKFVN